MATILQPKAAFVGKQIKVKMGNFYEIISFEKEASFETQQKYKALVLAGGGMYFENANEIAPVQAAFKVVRKQGLVAKANDSTPLTTAVFDLAPYKKMARNEFGALSKAALRKVAKAVGKPELSSNAAGLFDALKSS